MKYKVGERCYRKSSLEKEVVIIAIAGNKYVCRFVEDIEGKHKNRCYLYEESELTPKLPTPKALYIAKVKDRQSVTIHIEPFECRPPTDRDIAQLLHRFKEAEYVTVSTIFERG